jgi:rhodanese-related sulfurtransferase
MSTSVLAMIIGEIVKEVKSTVYSKGLSSEATENLPSRAWCCQLGFRSRHAKRTLSKRTVENMYNTVLDIGVDAAKAVRIQFTG